MKRRNFISTGVIGSLTGITLLSDAFSQPATGKTRAITNKRKKTNLKPFYIQPEYNQNGGIKFRFEQTDNQFSLVEFTVPAKTMGPAPHIHKDLDEIMRVLKGTVTVMVGDEIFEIKEGGWHFRPHGITHTFWNAGDEPATFIDLYPNQNFEVFLEELHKLFAHFEKQGVSPNSKAAVKEIDDLHAEWGIIMYHNQRQPLMDKYGLT